MGIQFDKNELENKLDEVINTLIKKGFMPAISGQEKKNLIENVISTLSNDPQINLTKDDLHKDGVHSALGIACMSALNKKFDYRILFKEQHQLDEHELKDSFKKLLTEMMKLTPAYKNKSVEEQKKLEDQIDELSEFLAQKLYKNDPYLFAENKPVLNMMSACFDPLSELRRELYGVAFAGEEFEAVQAIPAGNQMGLEDLATEGDSFMANMNEANPNVPDPLGVKMISIVNGLADGVTSVFEAESTLSDPEIIPQGPPKPKPH